MTKTKRIHRAGVMDLHYDDVRNDNEGICPPAPTKTVECTKCWHADDNPVGHECPSGRWPVPLELWGKDHWSTLGYMETVCVDYNGLPELRMVQCNPARHPQYVAYMPITAQPMDGSKYEIRLAFGKSIPGPDYDEWDCIEDMVSLGLLEDVGFNMTPQYRMTPLGNEVVSKLRSHKAAGGSFGSFHLSELPNASLAK